MDTDPQYVPSKDVQWATGDSFMEYWRHDVSIEDHLSGQRYNILGMLEQLHTILDGHIVRRNQVRHRIDLT